MRKQLLKQEHPAFSQQPAFAKSRTLATSCLPVLPEKRCRQLRKTNFILMYDLYIMQTNQVAQTLTRTQIYLTQAQQKRLALACRTSAVTKSELIRRAVDQFLDQQPGTTPAAKAQRLGKIAGLWAGRDDMADPSGYVQVLRAPRF